MCFNRIKTTLCALLFTIFIFAQTVNCVYAASVQDNQTINLNINGSQNSDEYSFEVENMFPGDHVIKIYDIGVSHNDDVTLKFKGSTNDDSNELAKALKTKITLNNGETLYDGRIVDMPQKFDFKVKTDGSTTKHLKYIIDVYLDTSAGNECMGLSIEVAFEWWVDEVDNLDDPPTGDDFKLGLWIVIMPISAMIVASSIISVKREEEYEK